MKRLSWIASALVVLALSLVAKAGPLEDAQDANSAALSAALSAYSDANDEYLPMSYLAGELDSILGDITEVEFDHPELWAELEAAWAAIAAADATYYEGVDLMEEGDSYWDDYDAAQSDSERIAILNTITGFYWDAWDCFDEAAGEYLGIADVLADLLVAVQAQVDAMAADAISSMNSARGTMTTAKNNKTSLKAIANTKYGEAWFAWDAAQDYFDQYQGPNGNQILAKIADGDANFNQGETLFALGEEKETEASGDEAEAEAKRTAAIAETHSATKFRLAKEAKALFDSARTKYAQAAVHFDDAAGEYTNAKTDYNLATTIP